MKRANNRTEVQDVPPMTQQRAGRRARAGTPVTAVDVIRDRILDLTLAPGMRIDDSVLMTKFGITRTPAREAFNRLAAEGLIVIQRNKGATVRALDIAHISQFFDAYGASERLVGFFCRTQEPDLVADLEAVERRYEQAGHAGHYIELTRINSEFHRRIAASSGNEYITDFANTLYNHARRLSYFIYLMTDGGGAIKQMQHEISGHHEDIIASIRAGDNAQLIKVLTQHAGYFHQWVTVAISTTRGLEAPLPA